MKASPYHDPGLDEDDYAFVALIAQTVGLGIFVLGGMYFAHNPLWASNGDREDACLKSGLSGSVASSDRLTSPADPPPQIMMRKGFDPAP